MTTEVVFFTEVRPEQWTYLLGHMEAGKPLPVLASPDLEEACRRAKEAGTHDYTIDGRHITITKRKLPATPVAFTDKLPLDKAFDGAEANVLAVTNEEATECKCRAAVHREKDRATLLPKLGTVGKLDKPYRDLHALADELESNCDKLVALAREVARAGHYSAKETVRGISQCVGEDCVQLSNAMERGAGRDMSEGGGNSTLKTQLRESVLVESIKNLLAIIHDDLTHARQADHAEAIEQARAALAAVADK